MGSPLRDSRRAATGRSPGFDYTAAVRTLCEALCRDLAELRHIEMSRMGVRICQTRRRGPYGVQATMTPLRFAGGATSTVRRGREWLIHPMPTDPAGRPYLYLFSLYVPRFVDLPAEEKLAVVVHELWHVAPQFDGDLRRFPGRYHAHGARCDRYHDEMRDLAARWPATRPAGAPSPADFLVGDFDSLRRRYGTIYGTRISTPRLWRTDRLPPAVLAARAADELHPDRRRPDERPPEERRRA
jgi:hypothetical protein